MEETKWRQGLLTDRIWMYFVKLFALGVSGYGFATYSKDIGIK
jgi:hypothetical protein